jgi:uncharacterized membrane protein (DUF2068 family)
MTTVARPAPKPRFNVLRTIALYKMVKVLLLHALRMVTLAYAAVFATEGIGLWMQKRWAEWLTTIITASLIPLEVWEVIFRPTVGKALVLVANTAIVIYLVWHVRSKRKR